MEKRFGFMNSSPPYIAERPHFQWFASPEDAMKDFENWADEVAADGKLKEVTYEIRPRDLTTMAELLDALNKEPGVATTKAEVDAATDRLLGKPSKQATWVNLDGQAT